METIIEMQILEDIEIGLKKDNIQIILEGMIEELAVVDLDQVQELVQMETELSVLNVENMGILLTTVPNLEMEGETEHIQ